MSKRGIHVNKWSKGGGYYYREEGYYSKTAKLGHEEIRMMKELVKLIKQEMNLCEKLIV